MLNHHSIFSEDTIFTSEEIVDNRGRIAIFIDGSNLFYAALQLGIEIDYTKLLQTLTAGSPLFRSFFYTGVDRTNEKQQGFLLWMRRYAADSASYRGARIEVVSLRAMTSDSLINVSDRYIDLESIKDDIKKPPRGANGYTYRPLSGVIGEKLEEEA